MTTRLVLIDDVPGNTGPAAPLRLSWHWVASVPVRNSTPNRAVVSPKKPPALRLMEPQLSPVAPFTFATMPSKTIVSPATRLLPLMVNTPLVGFVGPAPADKVVGLKLKTFVAASLRKKTSSIASKNNLATVGLT